MLTAWCRTGEVFALADLESGHWDSSIYARRSLPNEHFLGRATFMLNVIQYPQKYSEFEIQAELYMRLKTEGYHVRGEVTALCDDFGKSHKCRFDLVVFTPWLSPVVVIECKNHGDSFQLNEGTRQHRRYNKFGVPILRIGSIEQIQDIINLLDSEQYSD